jgi:uncharacterized protein (TIGR02996 family)
VTTEDDFQKALDASPNDWQARLVFADWLQEQGDPRAEGYRALGLLRRVPTWAFYQPLGRDPWYLWVSESYLDALIGLRGGSFKKLAKVLRLAALPADWCARIAARAPKAQREKWNTRGGWFGYGTTRREADDDAALAFARLPAARRAELLAAPNPRGAA